MWCGPSIWCEVLLSFQILLWSLQNGSESELSFCYLLRSFGQRQPASNFLPSSLCTRCPIPLADYSHWVFRCKLTLLCRWIVYSLATTSAMADRDFLEAAVFLGCVFGLSFAISTACKFPVLSADCPPRENTAVGIWEGILTIYVTS